MIFMFEIKDIPPCERTLFMWWGACQHTECNLIMIVNFHDTNFLLSSILT
jgi:hypothetical protein